MPRSLSQADQERIAEGKKRFEERMATTRAEREEREESLAKTRYIAAGGDEAAWPAAWATLREERARAAVDRVRARTVKI